MEPQRLVKLIAAAKAGSGEAYEALLDEYWPRLYGYFRRSVIDHHEAEDLLSEMSVRLVRQLTSYQEQGRFEHWLFRVAANLLRDRARRGKTRPMTASLSDDRNGQRSPWQDHLAADTAEVDQPMLATEQAGQLDRALAQLDETTRRMIVLRHYSEMTFREIAEMFGCPLGTALARVHRGLKTLRNLMETS